AGAEELRANDSSFAMGWERALQASAERLEQVARCRAIEGLIEPVLSDGKVVRDDNGQPIVVRRYSDIILLALLKARYPERFSEWKILSNIIYPQWIKILMVVLVGSIFVLTLDNLIILIMRTRSIL
ncbi:MAG TPA: hypothetical protein VGR45_10540, partial [Stellaceae bacterium]|nr:hypothetical protein [Stellaceae bacterium]